jgi:hypothetical protein
MVKFEKEDFTKWEIFRNNPKSTISGKEFELVCDLHARYKKHTYYKPCTCSPKTIKQWIKDLNVIWDNGYKEN